MKRGSLRLRIIAWSFVPAAIVLGAVALVTFYAYQEATTDLVRARDRELTHLSAGQLGTEMLQYSDLLLSLARNPDLFGPNLGRRQLALRRAENPLIVFDGGSVLLDAFGTVVATQPTRTDILGQDWSTRPYFRTMLRTRAPVFSNASTDGPQNAPVISVAVPVVGSQDELQGVLVGMFRLGVSTVSAFYGSVVKLRIGERLYLVDGQGQVIYHSDSTKIGTDVSGNEVVQMVLAGEAGDVPTRDEQGRDTVASFAMVPGTPWGLVVEESREALMGPTLAYQRFLLLLLFLGLAVPAVVVAFGVRRVTEPILRLAEVSQRVAGGEFGQTIALQDSAGDELEYLAQQFNTMSLQLQESYANLERRVADRTRELATLNAITGVVSASLELEEILRAALTKTKEVLHMDVGAAFRLDSSGTVLELVLQDGLAPAFEEYLSHLPVVQSLVNPAESKARPTYKRVSDYAVPRLRALQEEAGLQVVVGVPLMAKGKMLGALTVATRQPREVTPEELSLLEAIGQSVGVALENAQLYEQAEQAAAAAERSRLARELHDAVTQTLFSASLIAEVLPRLWAKNRDEGERRLDELRQLTRGALAEMRTLLLELRPSALADADLGELLRQLGEALIGRTRVPMAITIEGHCAMPPDVKVGLYRIAQEALNNVVKHAGATDVVVRLRCMEDERKVDLFVQDNGRGFSTLNAPANHLGLRIMRERADAMGAQLTVESEPGHGTHVHVIWQQGAQLGGGPAPQP